MQQKTSLSEPTKIKYKKKIIQKPKFFLVGSLRLQKTAKCISTR